MGPSLHRRGQEDDIFNHKRTLFPLPSYDHDTTLHPHPSSSATSSTKKSSCLITPQVAQPPNHPNKHPYPNLKMKFTIASIFLATMAAAAPAPLPVSAAGNTHTLMVKRSDFVKSGLLAKSVSLGKRDEIKQFVSDDSLAESVNYILVLFRTESDKVDPYQEEIDAADPAQVLG